MHGAGFLPIKDAPDECGMSRWYKGKKPAFAKVVRAWGCVAYFKVFNPASKVHDQAVRCVHLGRCWDQPGWRGLDPATGKIHTSPFVDFCENEYQGVTIDKSGREQFVPKFAVGHDPAAQPRAPPLPAVQAVNKKLHFSAWGLQRL